MIGSELVSLQSPCSAHGSILPPVVGAGEGLTDSRLRFFGGPRTTGRAGKVLGRGQFGQVAPAAPGTAKRSSQSQWVRGQEREWGTGPWGLAGAHRQHTAFVGRDGGQWGKVTVQKDTERCGGTS